MFLNESINVKDSAIFMGFMRQALVENLKEKDAPAETIKYITEDAKDCEVLSLAMYGKACPTDNPALAETYLMSNLKDFVLEHVSELPFDDGYTPSNFIHEIGGLSMVDSDSMTLIQEGILTEKYSKLAGADSGNRYPNSRAGEFSGVNSSGGTSHTYSKNAVDAAMRQSNASAAADNPTQAGTHKVYTPSYKGEFKGVNSAGTTGAANKSDMGGVGDDIAKQNNHSDMGGVGDEIAKNPPKEVAATGWLDRLRAAAGNVGQNISKAWSGFTQFVNQHSGGHAKAIGVTALVAMAAFLGYKAYQRYFSQAAKSCAGKSGAERSACIANAKKQAVKQQINMLKKSLSGCKAATNPAKCRTDLTAKISKLQAKLA